MSRDAHDLPAAVAVTLPNRDDLELDTVMLPRDAFFADTEDVPARKAEGGICAEQVTPYPPGIPVPDATDPALETIRVVA